MQAGTHHTDNTKQELRRAAGRKWRKNRDDVVLRVMREAERAAAPPRKQPGDRPCLGCGGRFRSQWCGNRLCLKCRDRDG